MLLFFLHVKLYRLLAKTKLMTITDDGLSKPQDFHNSDTVTWNTVLNCQSPNRSHIWPVDF